MLSYLQRLPKNQDTERNREIQRLEVKNHCLDQDFILFIPAN